MLLFVPDQLGALDGSTQRVRAKGDWAVLSLVGEDCTEFEILVKASGGAMIYRQFDKKMASELPCQILLPSQQDGHGRAFRRGFGNTIIMTISDKKTFNMLLAAMSPKSKVSSKKTIKRLALNERLFTDHILSIECDKMAQQCFVVFSPDPG